MLDTCTECTLIMLKALSMHIYMLNPCLGHVQNLSEIRLNFGLSTSVQHYLQVIHMTEDQFDTSEICLDFGLCTSVHHCLQATDMAETSLIRQYNVYIPKLSNKSQHVGTLSFFLLSKWLPHV